MDGVGWGGMRGGLLRRGRQVGCSASGDGWAVCCMLR